MGLTAILEDGRRDFLDATSGISHDVRPPTGWSVVECIEHVVTTEERYLEWLSGAREFDGKRDAQKEMRLFSIVRSRLTKVEAPEILRPRGRFATLKEALATFQAVRDRTVRDVRERGQAIYSFGISHPRFGELNGGELVQLIDGHARRHADQIREITGADD